MLRLDLATATVRVRADMAGFDNDLARVHAKLRRMPDIVRVRFVADTRDFDRQIARVATVVRQRAAGGFAGPATGINWAALAMARAGSGGRGAVPLAGSGNAAWQRFMQSMAATGWAGATPGGQPRNAVGQFMARPGGRAAAAAAAARAGLFARIGARFGGMGGGLSALGAQLGPTVGLGAGYGALQAGRATLDEAMQREVDRAELRRVTGYSAGGVAGLQGRLQDLAIRTGGVSMADVTGIAVAGAKAGLAEQGPDAVMKFTETMAALKAVHPEVEAENLSNGLLILLDLFGKGAEDAKGFASALERMDLASKSGIMEIFDITQRLAGGASAAGVSPERLLALSSMIPDVGLNPEAGASAMNRLFMGMATDRENLAKVLGIDQSKFEAAFREDPTKAFGMILKGVGSAGGGIEKADFIKNELGLSNVRDIAALTQLSAIFEREMDKRTAMVEEEMATGKALADGQKLFAETATAAAEQLKDSVMAVAGALGEPLLGPIKETAMALSGLAGIAGGMIGKGTTGGTLLGAAAENMGPMALAGQANRFVAGLAEFGETDKPGILDDMARFLTGTGPKAAGHATRLEPEFAEQAQRDVARRVAEMEARKAAEAAEAARVEGMGGAMAGLMTGAGGAVSGGVGLMTMLATMGSNAMGRLPGQLKGLPEMTAGLFRHDAEPSRFFSSGMEFHRELTQASLDQEAKDLVAEESKKQTNLLGDIKEGIDKLANRGLGAVVATLAGPE